MSLLVDAPANTNHTLAQQAQAAIQTNTNYINSTPTSATAIAQVMVLTKQINVIIKLLVWLLNKFGISPT